MEHQKKIKENEATKQLRKHKFKLKVESKRDKLTKAADMFKQLFSSL